MYMKIFLILSCYFLTVNNGFAQSNKSNLTYNKAVIFSVGIVNQANKYSLDDSKRTPNFSLRYRQYRKNLHFHQVSINNFWTKEYKTFKYNVKVWQIGLTYAYGAKILQLSNKCTFYLGGTAGLGYFSGDYESRRVQTFPGTEKQYSAIFGGFAEVQFFIAKRFVVNARFLSTLINLYVDKSKINNPSFPERLRGQSSFNFDAQYQAGLELGLGWRF